MKNTLAALFLLLFPLGLVAQEHYEFGSYWSVTSVETIYRNDLSLAGQTPAVENFIIF